MFQCKTDTPLIHMPQVPVSNGFSYTAYIIAHPHSATLRTVHIHPPLSLSPCYSHLFSLQYNAVPAPDVVLSLLQNKLKTHANIDVRMDAANQVQRMLQVCWKRVWWVLCDSLITV